MAACPPFGASVHASRDGGRSAPGLLGELNTPMGCRWWAVGVGSVLSDVPPGDDSLGKLPQHPRPPHHLQPLLGAIQPDGRLACSTSQVDSLSLCVAGSVMSLPGLPHELLGVPSLYLLLECEPLLKPSAFAGGV